MRYFGSKVSTLDKLHSAIAAKVPTGKFCDPFGGIGSVGSYFKSKGYTIWSGDVLKFPHYFQIARLNFSNDYFRTLRRELSLLDADALALYLNQVQGTDGWFVREYAKERRFFTLENARKIQACRTRIKGWAKKGWIGYEEHAVLLASLINSMDKVANTAGTYYAFLKKWQHKALMPFKFEFIHSVPTKKQAYCFNEDALSLVKRDSFDVIYLDPPYNERSYSHYYHLPETVAHEATPRVHGLSGIPDGLTRTSKFNSPSEAKSSLIEILKHCHTKLLVFHYADDGLIPETDLREIFSAYGRVDAIYLDSKGYSTRPTSRSNKHHIYMVENV